MKKIAFALAVSAASAFPVLASAQGANNAQPAAASVVRTPSPNYEDMFFDASKNPALTQDEKTAVSKRRAWNKTAAVTPSIARGGAIQFVYGTQEPSVICAVMQVCDIALQPGEQMNSINLGDSARWNVDPAVTGNGDNEVQHLIVKPLDVGLDTSMVVATDRRTYHIRLRSHRSTFMPVVTFAYPEDAQAKLEALARREIKDRQDRTIPGTGEYLGNLDFNYCSKGKAPWKPVRTYNDGRKTIIELPDNVPQSEAPTLLVESPYSSSPGLVNSRLQNNRFIVDQLFDKAILIVGVGGDQRKITITRGKCN